MNTNQSGLNLPAWVVENFDAIASFQLLPTAARGCFVTGCRRDAVRCGLCRAHFVRARDTFGPVPPSRDSAARQRARREYAGVVPASPEETDLATPNNNDQEVNS